MVYTKIIIAKFLVSGLTPVIYIVDVANDVLLVNGDNMTELTARTKVYKYTYTNYDPAHELYFEIDGGASLADSVRYPTAVNELNKVEAVETGRWRILNNQMIFYEGDDATALFTYDLKDSAGNPTETNPYERVPV